MALVYLDSNIYRQYGHKFMDNIDYKNLSDLLHSSGHEFGLLEVVHAEILDYFKHDVFNVLLASHQKLHHQYRANPYLASIDRPETSKVLLEALKKVEIDLRDQKFFSPSPEILPKLLIEFLLENKRITSKDNTRDFLIFYALVFLCKQHTEDHVVFISNDAIFTSNLYFKRFLLHEKVTNLKFFSSIAEFLKDFGPQLPFITEDVLLKKINIDDIKAELMQDIKCLPSYVSMYYYDKKDNEVPDVESLTIKGVHIDNFYITKDYDKNVLLVTIMVAVHVIAIFSPESNKTELQAYLSRSVTESPRRYRNTFDDDGRPIFDREILFLLQGTVEESIQSINELAFLDFIPDYYMLNELMADVPHEPSIMHSKEYCLHNYDTNNGYLKNSFYRNESSVHFRCSLCGAEYDTGESHP